MGTDTREKKAVCCGALPLICLPPRWQSCVAQVSKPAVSPTSKSARLPHAQRVWKPAARQTWKSALRLTDTPTPSEFYSRRRRRKESQISPETRPESETPDVVSYFLNGLLAWAVPAAFLLAGVPSALAQDVGGVAYADSGSFTLDTTGMVPGGGGVAYSDSGNFTLDTTGILPGGGGVAYSDSGNFTLDTTGIVPGGGGVAYSDSGNFTLDTTGILPGGGGVAYSDSGNFTLDTTGILPGGGGVAYADSANFTLDTTGMVPGGGGVAYSDSGNFTLDTTSLPPGVETTGCIRFLNTGNLVFTNCNCITLSNYALTAANACCGNVTLTFNPPLGASFCPGTNLVTVTGTDTCGDSNSTNFYVTVIPITNPPPVINCPGNMMVSTACSSIQVYYDVTASSALCGNVDLVVTPPSGSFFPVGTNTVTAVATDCCGNSSPCSFTVTVNQSNSCVAGITWTQQAFSYNNFSAFNSVASSCDGSKLVTVARYGDNIYTSTDSGVTWTQRAGPQDWTSVASSSDGSKLVAVVSGGSIYTSTDSGTNWTAHNSAGNRNWWSVASSSDGSKLVAVVYGGYIYTSTDSGTNWTGHATSQGSQIWYAVSRCEQNFTVGKQSCTLGIQSCTGLGVPPFGPWAFRGGGKAQGPKGGGAGAVKYNAVDQLSCFHEKKYLSSSSASALRSFATSCSNSAMASARLRKPPLNCRSPNAGSISFFTVTSKRWASVRSSNGRPDSPEARDVRLGPRPSKTWSCGCSRPNRPALIAWSPRSACAAWATRSTALPCAASPCKTTWLPKDLPANGRLCAAGKPRKSANFGSTMLRPIAGLWARIGSPPCCI